VDLRLLGLVLAIVLMLAIALGRVRNEGLGAREGA
jgi:hypothetical protein